MTHEPKWQEFAELYALGALDGQDLSVFREHAAGGCPECAHVIRETRSLLGALPHTLSPITPSPALKARLMAEIASPAQGVPAFPELARLFGLALAAALSVAGIAFWLTSQTPAPAGISHVRHSSPHTEELTAILSEESTKMLPIESGDSRQTLYGKLVWNFRHCGGCLLLKNLIKIPADKVFQLWGIDDQQKPVSIGVFTADSAGNAHVDFYGLQKPEHFTAFKITVENTGGALAPTTQPLLQARF